MGISESGARPHYLVFCILAIGPGDKSQAALLAPLPSSERRWRVKTRGGRVNYVFSKVARGPKCNYFKWSSASRSRSLGAIILGRPSLHWLGAHLQQELLRFWRVMMGGRSGSPCVRAAKRTYIHGEREREIRGPSRSSTFPNFMLIVHARFLLWIFSGFMFSCMHFNQHRRRPVHPRPP